MADTKNPEQPSAAQKETKQTQSAGGVQPQARPCPKDCNKCGFQQHAFCAAKMSFDAFSVMSQIIQKLDAQSLKIAELSHRLSAIKATESELAAPMPVEGDLFHALKDD